MSPSAPDNESRQATLERATAALQKDRENVPARLVASYCHAWNRYRGTGTAETALG